MKLGNFSSVGIYVIYESFNEKIDGITRESIDRDLYWYIDDFTWTSIRQSVYSLHQSIQQQHEVRKDD
jgi:hypothetical protein